MKGFAAVLLSAVLFFGMLIPGVAAESVREASEAVSASEEVSLPLDAKGAILMEASSGTVLYEKESRERLYPASVTKVMTMLLIMEGLQEGTVTEGDIVTASENACSYGGTQIYLEPGEEMSLQDLLKAVCINSANDAAVALAEHLSGSEAAFVARMNERASELGAVNTHFVNPCGLPDADHYTCAYDVALFTRELLNHPHILDYTGIWMDSLRDGGFGLANTNKLLKTYTGLTGMKTGYTQEAGHCLSATATRGEMSLIAVVLGGESSKGRFASAAALLDYGFSGYTVLRRQVGALDPVPVTKGKEDFVSIEAPGEFSVVVQKNKTSELTLEVSVEDAVRAPVQKGQTVGTARFLLKGEEVYSIPVVACQSVEKAGFFDYFSLMAEALL